MEVKTDEKEQETVPRAPWIPRVVAGGKDGGDHKFGDGPDWLRDLPVGSTFLAQDKHFNNSREDKYWVLGGPFTVAFRTGNGRGVVLAAESPTGQHAFMPVDSLRFSSKYSLFDILNLGDGRAISPEEFNEQEEAPEGDTKDGSEGSVQS